METLVISPDFTIDDIHRIREQNYERTKDMTVMEKAAYYNNSGKEAEKEINRRRVLKRKSIAGGLDEQIMRTYTKDIEKE